MSDVRLEVERYIHELQLSNERCERPRKDSVTGESMPCLQCYERANVIRRLREILSK